MSDISLCVGCGTAMCGYCDPSACPHGLTLCIDCVHSCIDCRHEIRDDQADNE